MYTRDEMIKMLNEGACYITFTRVRDGEVRNMRATLRGSEIPAEKFPTSGGSPNDEIIRCYDLDKEGWRSFRVDSVTAFANHWAHLDGSSEYKARVKL